MKASALSKYAFINAKLRGRISKILPDEVFGRLAKAPSLDAALDILQETSFAELYEIYSSTGDLKKGELELLKKEIELYVNIKEHVHQDSIGFVNALLYKFEIENLKNSIRIYFDKKIRNRSADPNIHYILYEPIIHEIPIDVIINAENFDEIAGVCEGTPYSAIIKKYSHTAEAKGSLFRMEVAFDHFYYDNLLSTIKKMDRRDRIIVTRLIGVEIDLQNINWLIRLKNFYDLPLDAVMATIVPGGFNLNRAVIMELYRAQNVTPVLQNFVKGKYPGLSALLSSQTSDSYSRLLLIHRILEEIIKHEVRRVLAGYPFTIGIIFSYFILKSDELKKIRTILNAKKYDIQPQRIESMI
ncbi:MAG: V-type ATPase subunit [Sedimentisphaerales bacterium]|nr:V-type ATPase subunit [Sedimentisphaerales bacterium]